MSSTLQNRQSLEHEADDAMLIDPPSPRPDTQSARTTPTEKQGHFVSRPGPVDEETAARTEMRINRILEARIHIIGERLAAAAALEYEPADLATSIDATAEEIMEGMEDAMVWTPNFENFRDSNFSASFDFPVGPATNQVLRAMFPGVGIHNGNGKEKGWNMNVYSLAEFRDCIGTDVIARIGSSMAELTGAVAVGCLMQKGKLTIHGMYKVLEV